MPRYYFNLYRSDAPPTPDEIGLELESHDHAKREALQSLPSLLSETLSEELKPVYLKIEVVHEGSAVIAVMTANVGVGPQR